MAAVIKRVATCELDLEYGDPLTISVSIEEDEIYNDEKQKYEIKKQKQFTITGNAIKEGHENITLTETDVKLLEDALKALKKESL